jgi:hypothetical protein
MELNPVIDGIETIDEFHDKVDKTLAITAGKVLQREYAGYIWGVRVIAKRMIQIILAELIPFGGDRHGMVINPRDWDTLPQFEALVRKMGGELLERASLSRNGSQGLVVTKRPDGFHQRLDQTQSTRRIILQ